MNFSFKFRQFFKTQTSCFNINRIFTGEKGRFSLIL